VTTERPATPIGLVAPARTIRLAGGSTATRAEQDPHMSDSSPSLRSPIRLLAMLALASSLVVQAGCTAVIATGAVVGATVGLGAAVVGTAVGAGVAAGGAVIDAVSSGDEDKTKAAAPAVEAAPVRAPAAEPAKNVY
jgi:hypothetical protein